MLSYSRPVERCRALLGTFVRIRVCGLAPERANVAIDAAFAEIARIHSLMSFHEYGSDISRLNRNAHTRSVAVDLRTHEVLCRSLQLASESDGAFDVTVAPTLVQRGVLPPPKGAPAPDDLADWRDIECHSDSRVRFHRPLWIDLGGIAKGYAVDRAIEALMTFSPTQTVVNAGGDLRVAGSKSGRVLLRDDIFEPGQTAMIEIQGGAVASSSGRMHGRAYRRSPDAHVDGCHGRKTHPRRFVSVTAPRCIDADALTKIVMAKGEQSRTILASHAARCFVYANPLGWRQFPGLNS
jgi:FAD:protein FMN transferase